METERIKTCRRIAKLIALTRSNHLGESSVARDTAIKHIKEHSITEIELRVFCDQPARDSLSSFFAAKKARPIFSNSSSSSIWNGRGEQPSKDDDSWKNRGAQYGIIHDVFYRYVLSFDELYKIGADNTQIILGGLQKEVYRRDDLDDLYLRSTHLEHIENSILAIRARQKAELMPSKNLIASFIAENRFVDARILLDRVIKTYSQFNDDSALNKLHKERSQRISIYDNCCCFLQRRR